MLLTLSVALAPALAGEKGSGTERALVSSQLIIDAAELAEGLEAHRVLDTETGLKFDRRNLTDPAESARITTDVIDLGGTSLLSQPVDLRRVQVSIQSNAVGADRVQLELRSGSSYFQAAGAWDDWKAITELQPPRGRYLQLRISAWTDRDDFRITGVRIDIDQRERSVDIPVIKVDGHIQTMVSSTIPFGYQRPDHSDCDSPPLSDSGGDRIMVPVGGPKDERVTAGRAASLAAV